MIGLGAAPMEELYRVTTISISHPDGEITRLYRLLNVQKEVEDFLFETFADPARTINDAFILTEEQYAILLLKYSNLGTL